MIKTVGSVCSGIEAASVAWNPIGAVFNWFSEIAPFPSLLLREKYPHIPNVGDMNNIPAMLRNGSLPHCDLICGGTPCQAFSLAGWKNGLNDDRGNLTLKFVDIIEANDNIRKTQNLKPSIVFWENVEGVLTDKTNAFGCFVSSLAGLDSVITLSKWPTAGLLRGPRRNIAWRVLDAKFFGVPQQRKRLYLLAGGKDFHPEHILFETHSSPLSSFPQYPLKFNKENCTFEVFREYTDCLYSAYGTKWNGNAAANNGSLFVVQDHSIRRFSPLECERLMGFPDNYTQHPKASRTTRYQAIGNSWTIPVIRWIGERLFTSSTPSFTLSNQKAFAVHSGLFFDFSSGIVPLEDGSYLNCTPIPENPLFRSLSEIITSDAPSEIYISPVGCYGMVRRKNERRLSMNPRLETVLLEISSQMSLDEIEKRSRVQKRGLPGQLHPTPPISSPKQLSLM